MNCDEEKLLQSIYGNISNLEEKQEVAKKVLDKVKNGQVIRIWLWFNIIFGNN